MEASIRGPVAVIALCGLFWGTSFVAMKIGLDYVDPYSFAFLRLFTAFVFSAAFLFIAERPRVSMLRDRSIWALGVLNAGAFVLQYVGLAYTTATRTALIVNANVTLTALLSWKVYHESMGFGKLLALPTAILGVFLLVTGGDLSSLSGGQATGDLLVLLAGVVWSFFLVLNKGMVSKKEVNVPQMVVWVMLVTALAMVPFAGFLGDVGRTAVPWQGWVAVAYTAVFCTVIPYQLFAKAQRSVTVTFSSLVLLIEVIVAAVSSTLILGEQFALGSGLGAVLVCASIVLASRGSGSG
ncbi:DMT family transporter [[Eubacterium] cellulosolvens]